VNLIHTLDWRLGRTLRGVGLRERRAARLGYPVGLKRDARPGPALAEVAAEAAGPAGVAGPAVVAGSAMAPGGGSGARRTLNCLALGGVSRTGCRVKCRVSACLIGCQHFFAKAFDRGLIPRGKPRSTDPSQLSVPDACFSERRSQVRAPSIEKNSRTILLENVDTV
jgi:hypothetical protein